MSRPLTPYVNRQLLRVKELAFRGMNHEEDLTYGEKYDKVRSISDDQEQELQLDLELYDEMLSKEECS